MTAAALDIVAIGNAIVDILSPADDALLHRHGLAKGTMRLITPAIADALYGEMGPAIEASGGSAANTIAGIAALGGRAAFIGQVADDQFGAIFEHDMRSLGVQFDVVRRLPDPPTGRCLILVSDDGQRTMNTCLGASEYLPAEAIDLDLIASADILYCEGYLWDPIEPRRAMRSAIHHAKRAGRRVAFTCSETFCIDRHRADFLGLMNEGSIDLLFANEVEIQSLMQKTDFDRAVELAAKKVPLLVVTRGASGAIAIDRGDRVSVPAEPVAQVIDTTGAGDLFAAGFLAGQAQGRSVKDALVMGAICAAEVISHFGARPETDLRELVSARLP